MRTDLFRMSSAARLLVYALALFAFAPAAQSEVPQTRPAAGPVSTPPGQDDLDRGIGGTGVVGTIRGFGSIIVNGLRVTYGPDAVVRIDGQLRPAAALRVGHVVRFVARQARNGSTTRHIDAVSEVVGPIQAVRGSRLTILGQTVLTGNLRGARWKVGDRVAVFGLRRPDGTVVASLIEPKGAGPNKVAGARLRGVGSLEFPGERVSRVLIETYVERTRSGLRLGPGLSVSGTTLALPVGSAALAVVTLGRDQAGRLVLSGIRIEGPVSGPATPARAGILPGGQHPDGPPTSGGAVGSPGGRVGGTLSGAGSSVGDSLGAVGGSVGDTLGGVGGAVGGVGGSVGGAVGETIGGVGGAVGGVGGSVGGAVGDAVGGVGGTVGDSLGGLGGR